VKRYLQKKLNDHEIQYFILLAVIGTFMMAFCSYTSPAFYFDYSPDNNAFFTVGKAMMNGIVPYKDIFEQKGPLLYLIYGFAAKTGLWFHGIFILECVLMAISLWLLNTSTSSTASRLPGRRSTGS